MNSGQYPVQMTRKPMQERGLKGVKNPKTPLGEPATGPSSSFRKSVSIYPRSPPELISFLENATLFLVQTLWFLYLPQNNYLKAIPFTEAYRYSQFIAVSPLPTPTFSGYTTTSTSETSHWGALQNQVLNQSNVCCIFSQPSSTSNSLQ